MTIKNPLFPIISLVTLKLVVDSAYTTQYMLYQEFNTLLMSLCFIVSSAIFIVLRSEKYSKGLCVGLLLSFCALMYKISPDPVVAMVFSLTVSVGAILVTDVLIELFKLIIPKQKTNNEKA